MTSTKTASLEPKGLGELLVVPTVGTSVEVSKQTQAAKKRSWKESIESFDVQKLVEFQDTMSRYIDKIVSLQDLASTESFDGALAQDLMEEALDNVEIMGFLTARKEMYREAVFQALNVKLEEEGCDDPEHTNGSIEVPQLGKRFAREGCGYKDPSLDLEKLADLIGKDLVDEMYEEKTVVTKTFSEEKFLEVVAKNPEVLEAARECTIRGAAKPARFAIRDMK